MKSMKHQCPFCDEWIVHSRFRDGFCKCSAHYYVYDNVWLDCKTGKLYKGMKKLEYVDGGEG